VPVSKKRKKKNERKPLGPPISKTGITSRKKKFTKQQILIYVFSALIILSFVLSFLVGYGGRRSGTGSGADTSSGSNGILFTPVPGSDNSEASDATRPSDNNTSPESEAGN
jgi:hypothetical protein